MLEQRWPGLLVLFCLFPLALACQKASTEARTPAGTVNKPAPVPKTTEATPSPRETKCPDGKCQRTPLHLEGLSKERDVALTWSNGEVVYAYTGEGEVWRYQPSLGWALDGTPPDAVIAFGPASDAKSATALMADGRILLRHATNLWHTTAVTSNLSEFGRIDRAWVVHHNTVWATLRGPKAQGELVRWKHREWRKVPTPEGVQPSQLGQVSAYPGHAWVTYFDETTKQTRFYHRKLRPKPEWREDAPALAGRHLVSVSEDGKVFALSGKRIQGLVDNKWRQAHTVSGEGTFRWVRSFGSHQVAFFAGAEPSGNRLFRFDGVEWSSGSAPPETEAESGLWLAPSAKFSSLTGPP